MNLPRAANGGNIVEKEVPACKIITKMAHYFNIKKITILNGAFKYSFVRLQRIHNVHIIINK